MQIVVCPGWSAGAGIGVTFDIPSAAVLDRVAAGGIVDLGPVLCSGDDAAAARAYTSALEDRAMPERGMTEAEAVARFSRELDEIAARGRAPDSAEQVAEVIAENERACAMLREDRLARARTRLSKR